MNELPEISPSASLRRRTLARSHALLAARTPWARFVAVLEPTLVLAGAASYLVWAVHFCNALGQGS